MRICGSISLSTFSLVEVVVVVAVAGSVVDVVEVTVWVTVVVELYFVVAVVVVEVEVVFVVNIIVTEATTNTALMEMTFAITIEKVFEVVFSNKQ